MKLEKSLLTPYLAEKTMDFTSIHNYYEHIVANYVQAEIAPRFQEQEEDFFIDIACFALTKLPTRYLRHDIDMAFYSNEEERISMGAEVKNAVDEAVAYIEANFNKYNRDD